MNRVCVRVLAIIAAIALLGGCHGPWSSQSATANDAGFGHATIRATGTSFTSVTNDYLDITLSASASVEVMLEVIPRTVIFAIEATGGDESATVTLAGFEPRTTYYMYEDSYANLTEFESDGRGRFSYVQDLRSPHLVIIQPHTSTLFLTEDGWSDPSVGTWDPTTRTARLTQDINESIEVQVSDAVIDGGGHLVSGQGAGFGIYQPRTFYQPTGIAIRNIRIRGFSCGIYGFEAGYSIGGPTGQGVELFDNGAGLRMVFGRADISESSIHGNANGLDIDWAGGSVFNNSVYDNEGFGISFEWFSGPHIAYNSVFRNGTGISLNEGRLAIVEDNHVYGNTAQGIGFAVYELGCVVRYNRIENNRVGVKFGREGSGSNRYYNNNFIDNAVQAEYTAHGYLVPLLNLDPPIGGNYWSDWTGPDEDGDGFVDLPYVVWDGAGSSGGPPEPIADAYPWTRPDGWLIHTTPAQGTMGTDFTLTGRDFGEDNYYNVRVARWKNVVHSWEPTRIDATFIHQLAPGSYDVSVTRRDGEVLTHPSGFTIMPPSLDSDVVPMPLEASPGDEIDLEGRFFGGENARFQVFVWSRDTSWLKWRAAVLEWQMDSVSGESSATFVVPEIPPGTYHLRLRNLISWSEYYDDRLVVR